ncbi:hypothetical protein ONS95_006035 [Cadophora gregata]|uniref:uncharacterized protein n=1 Tax=Cadophora gregata TaxID=51156 RepID=UPI0026DDC8B0|nr:uncharacterized protein ONS95_006035 [Cadophora gregata]KAK0102415.1 hypothetical protein ONS95_006035 [Cadophora gregata]KAK0104041.1 hypothetical protein ONS96_005144 [Cadophora gregata f. sp. sojae]
MASRRRKNCLCFRSLHLSSAVLFLSTILPSSSFAQITDPASSSPSNFATSLSSSTLQTSTTSNASPSPTQSASPASSSSSAGDNNDGRNTAGMFNYYFIIVAVVVVLFVLTMLYIGKRKKQKAAIMRSNSQRALAEDVEGLRNRFGMGRGAMRRAHAGGLGSGEGRGAAWLDERTEGLNERGEAPPPYRPGSKPPSLRSNDGVAVMEVSGDSRPGSGQPVEMNTIERPTPTLGQDPPGYHEETNRNENRNNGGTESWADLEMTRPAPVVTAPPRRDTSTE